ncbi:hypothetical protein, conserved [Eimeria praecox]|uniref:Uncharacterized protein n=1 Tax=Eimeria praecox TaxID=51316 RepID=U6G0N7_9EIME|nr:hypothetical protein, conserved [Eimeria praecox]
MSSRGAPHKLVSNELSHHEELTLDDDSMKKYWDDFNAAADEMKAVWESSELPVRRAFLQYFTPSLGDAKQPPKDPLATINDNVAKMKGCKVPSDASVKERGDFAKHLQLLRSICCTVMHRVNELKWLIHVNQENGVPVPVPGYEQAYSYRGLEDISNSMVSKMRASDFLGSLELAGGEGTQEVDGIVGKDLIFLLSIENKHHLYNLVAQHYFERFLEPFGEGEAAHATRAINEYQIPYNGKVFRTGDLAHAAARILRESNKITNYAHIRKVYRMAENWTNRRVLKAAKQQAEENAHNFQQRLNDKREQMRALLKLGIPADDLVMSVLFLL